MFSDTVATKNGIPLLVGEGKQGEQAASARNSRLRKTRIVFFCQSWCDTQLKPPDERTQICQERLSAQGKLWPVDEPRCDLTSVRHQGIRVSVTVTLCADQST